MQNDTTTEVEVWKDIPGYEGLYQASSLGMIRSLDRDAPYTKHKTGTFTKSIKGHVRTTPRGRGGYRHILLSDGRGKRENLRICRIIAETFIGPCPDGYQCCHINGIRDDDRACNLRWDTPKGNCKDKYKHGTNGRKYTEEMVALIILGSVSYREAMDIFSMPSWDYTHIITNKPWRTWKEHPMRMCPEVILRNASRQP